MNRTKAAVIVCAVLMSPLGAALAGQQARTQWDGVYSKTQADQGAKTYAKYCSSCHGADLSGGEVAPALTGGDFNANWNELSLGGLFDRMRLSMPQNNPGSLDADDNAAILAYILSMDGFPAGANDLPTQAGLLGAIKFVAEKPEH